MSLYRPHFAAVGKVKRQRVEIFRTAQGVRNVVNQFQAAAMIGGQAVQVIGAGFVTVIFVYITHFFLSTFTP